MIDNKKIEEFINYIKNDTFISKQSDNDKLLLSIIFTLIKNNLLNDLYNEIPKNILDLFKDGNYITALDFFKNKLREIGISDDIITSLTFVDLMKLQSTLSLFVTNQSSMNFFKAILSVYDENISAGELFIDMLNDTTPVFKIKWFYKSRDDLPEYYDYDTVVSSIPGFIINKEDIINEYQSGNLLLPLKTNIIVLDSYTINDISDISILTSIIFKRKFSSEIIKVLVSGKYFNIELKDIPLIVQYIDAKVKGVNVLNASNSNICEIMISDTSFTMTLEDFDNLTISINNARTKEDVDKIKSIIKNNINILKSFQPTEFLLSDLESDLYTKYQDLIVHINSILSNVSDPLLVYSGLINDISSSLLYHGVIINDYLYNKYVPYFLSTFVNMLKYDILKSKTYMFINEFKPIIVELFTIGTDSIIFKINDILQSIYISDNHYLNLNLNNVSWENIIELFNLFITPQLKSYKNFDDNIELNHTIINRSGIIIKGRFIIMLYLLKNVSTFNFRDIFRNYYMKFQDIRININDIFNIYFN